MHSDSSSTLPTKVLGMWTCPICSYQNTEDIEKCQLCGVIKPANIQVTTSSPTSSTPQVVETDVNACPVCTFINHPSMVRCEMCDSEIGKASSTPVLYESGNASPVSITPPPEEAETDDPYIKIAFRVGGYTTWLSNLKSAIAAKAWEQVWYNYADIDRQTIHLQITLEGGARIGETSGGKFSWSWYQ
jgi:ESCRT-II complex subunit VPS36